MAKEINRRDFLKVLGGSTATASTLLAACKNSNAMQHQADKNRQKGK